MPKSQYRTDDVSHDLKGSAAARVRMIARMSGTSVEDVRRKDGWEQSAREHAAANTRLRHVPEHMRAVHDLSVRFDGKTGAGSKDARERMLQRIRDVAAGKAA